MSTNVKIRYINRSMNPDLPTVFVFAKNEVPTFDSLREGVAWKTIPDIGKGSSCSFSYPVQTQVVAAWNEGACQTRMLNSTIGQRYTVQQDNTGIVLAPNGSALDAVSIEVNNTVQTPGGIQAQLYKDGKLLMSKNIVAYGQKATFVLHPKLYWGIASEIQEGMELSSAVLNTDNFFEQDLEGVSSVDVVLYGNPKEGYYFQMENQK